VTFLSDIREAAGGRVEERVDLSERTSMRVGGAADLLVTPPSEAALVRVLDVCVRHSVPYAVLGAGTNTIVSDAGVRGVVIRISPELVPEEVLRLEPAALAQDARDEGSVALTICAGRPVSRLVSLARKWGCVGMEFLVGIPGSVGGAVAMNAGTRSGSIEQICVEVGICEPGGARTLRAEKMGFAYRTTALPEGAVMSWARFRLEIGGADELARSRQAMDEDLAYRRRTQPLPFPSAGSIFKNPPGDHAARLIEACGLKGMRQGDAQISELHANFIVNRGKARAEDVVSLMRRVQTAVLERFSVQLIPEVNLMGPHLPWGRGDFK
jgi:UDP-N-acetylmuramate dehydrogenase